MQSMRDCGRQLLRFHGLYGVVLFRRTLHTLVFLCQCTLEVPVVNCVRCGGVMIAGSA